MNTTQEHSLKKIKLVIFQYSMASWGGAENIIWKVGSFLQKTGMYEITVVGMVNEQPSFETHMQAIGIRTYCLGINDKKSILLQLGKLWHLNKILKEIKPDILFNVLFPSIFAGGIIGKLSSVPHIIGNIHGPALFKKKIAVLLDRLVSPIYEGYITVAPHIKEQFTTREKLPASKIQVIPNGLEIKALDAHYNRDNFRNALGITQTDIVIGTIGRIYPEKNQKYLVDIGSHLVKQLPYLKLLIVGDGPKFNELKTYIKEKGMEQYCVLPGWQTTTTGYLKAMDLFCLPSFYEGLPCSILEAWQQKVPVSGTNVRGIRDLITDHKTGVLLPINDPQAAAKKIAELLADPQKLKLLSDLGYATWQEKYTVEKMSEAHHQYFLNLVKK